MFKRLLIFALLVVLSGWIYFQGWTLHLALLVLLPVLIFPAYYFLSDASHKFYIFIVIGLLILLGVGYYRFHSIELLSIGASMVVSLGLLILHRAQWLKEIATETVEESKSEGVYKSLKQKYDTRVESLHRLEKQVASLMGLFEVARDFSECLSFEEMTKQLSEKVMPQLPFQQMQFLLLGYDEEEMIIVKNFKITSKGSELVEPIFSEKLEEVLKQVYVNKKMVKTEISLPGQSRDLGGEKWIFPLVIEDTVSAFVMIEGAHQEDIVRFEVLIAHLILQVKKIRLYEKVRELSIVDSLTGLYVRRHFLERFHEEVERSIRYELPLAVLMLDIDHFKRYNDQFGHLVGDATLREVADLLRDNLRKVDIIARYGGEEFVAVLPETSGVAAREAAERIRSSVARHQFKVYDVDAQVTVSLGVALYPSDIKESEKKKDCAEIAFDLIRHADRALYRAKEEGRNRVYRYEEL